MYQMYLNISILYKLNLEIIWELKQMEKVALLNRLLQVHQQKEWNEFKLEIVSNFGILLDYDFQFTGEIYDDYSKNQLENFSGISKHEFPEDTEEKKPFAIVGYDKDYDVYVEYKRFRNLVVAEAFATYLKKSLEKGTLKRKCSDGILKPIDWVQVVDSENFDKVFWASYEFSERDVKDIMKELSDEVLIEYKSIIFDHWTIDEETDGIYGEICEHCAKKYKNLLSKELNDGGIGPCSVKGCGVVGIDADKNNHYYVTFKPELIRIHERKEWIVNE